jgi:hypothetical protein
MPSAPNARINPRLVQTRRSVTLCRIIEVERYPTVALDLEVEGQLVDSLTEVPDELIARWGMAMHSLEEAEEALRALLP